MNKTIHELNSLSQAEATDELIIYDVSEGESKKIQVENLVGNPNYSTEETFTGKYWFDGKKIYSKCFSYPNGVNIYNQWSEIKNKENEDLIISGFWSTITPYSGNNTSVSSAVCAVGITNANKIVVFVNHFEEARETKAIVLEYTKTTD